MRELKSCQQEAVNSKLTSAAKYDSNCGTKRICLSPLDCDAWRTGDANSGEDSDDNVSLHEIMEPSVTWPDTDSDCDNSEDPCENSPAMSLTPQHFGATPRSNFSGSPSSPMTHAVDFSQVCQHLESPISPEKLSAAARVNALKLEALLPICEGATTTHCSDLCNMQNGSTPPLQRGGTVTHNTGYVKPGPILLGRTKVGAQLQKIDGVDSKNQGPVLRGHRQAEPGQKGIGDPLPGDRIGHELQSKSKQSQQIELASCIKSSAGPVPTVNEDKPPEVTTMMIRNIPRSMTQQGLIDALENTGFSGMYDFCYVPSSFDSKQNKGFAFVNMISAEAAGVLVGSWHNRKIFAGTDGVRNALSLCPSIVQGREANLEKMNQPRQKRIRNPKHRPFVV